MSLLCEVFWSVFVTSPLLPTEDAFVSSLSHREEQSCVYSSSGLDSSPPLHISVPSSLMGIEGAPWGLTGPNFLLPGREKSLAKHTVPHLLCSTIPLIYYLAEVLRAFKLTQQFISLKESESKADKAPCVWCQVLPIQLNTVLCQRARDVATSQYTPIPVLMQILWQACKCDPSSKVACKMIIAFSDCHLVLATQHPFCCTAFLASCSFFMASVSICTCFH